MPRSPSPAPPAAPTDARRVAQAVEAWHAQVPAGSRPTASPRAGDAGAGSPAEPCRIDLALQGGGSHGAFTWGVLDRLLDEEGLEFAALSGTSAGAMNAVAVAAGLAEGGRRGAQAALARLWQAVGRLGSLLPSPSPSWPAPASAAWAAGAPWWAAAQQAWQPWLQPWQAWQSGWANGWRQCWGQAFSPYQTNPWGLNPLRLVLHEAVDFDAVRRCGKTQLYIAATEVHSGRLRVFDQAELTPEVVLASACLPMMFQAVEIDGQPYWDGGYAGNPSLLPLVMQSDADDLLLIQINPIVRAQTPTTASDILERMNEITFNASLLKELRNLATLNALAVNAPPDADPLLQRAARLRLHRIHGGDELAAFGAGTKTQATPELLQRLHALGRREAKAWLQAHRQDLGRRSSVAWE